MQCEQNRMPYRNLSRNYKYAYINEYINFTFKSRSVDDFIGVFNFIFEFSDGTNYPFRLGRIAIGNDIKLNSISRTIFIR